MNFGIKNVIVLKGGKLPLPRIRVVFVAGFAHRFAADSTGEWHPLHRLSKPVPGVLARQCLDCEFSTHPFDPKALLNAIGGKTAADALA
jgi:hypothetical protein